MIKVEIDSLMASVVSNDRFVVLRGEQNRYVMLALAPCEVDALAIKLNDQSQPRPTTYEFFFQFLRQTNLSIEAVYLYWKHDGLIQAQIGAKRRNLGSRQKLTVSCKLGDGLLTAVHFAVPIYVSSPIMLQLSGTLDELLGNNMRREAIEALSKASSEEAKPT